MQRVLQTLPTDATATPLPQLAQVFCDACAPKGPTGVRKCAECLDLKGVSEFLSQHPDVAFRMRALHSFLSACMMGPLAESPTLRFFIAAPLQLFEKEMTVRLRAAERKRDEVHSPSVIGNAWAAVGGRAMMFEKECATPPKMLSPRSQQRRAWGRVLSQRATEYERLRKELARELAEGLARKPHNTPSLPDRLEAQPELTALREACIAADAAATEFSDVNKGLLFHLTADAAFVTDLMRAAFDTVVRIEQLQHARSACKDPARAALLDSLVQDSMDGMHGDLAWLERYHAVCVRKMMGELWQRESVRDPCLFDWAGILHHVERVPDTGF